MLKSILSSVVVIVGLSTSLTTHAADLAGTWRTVDDKSGVVRAHIKVVKLNDGSYSGTIVDDFPAQGEIPLTSCSKCPEPYTNKPIIGLQIMSGFRQDAQDPDAYINGKVLDPRAGKIYSGKAKLSPDGKKLRLRGYVGVSLLGRSQTWLREN